jgi:hypothetical protein
MAKDPGLLTDSTGEGIEAKEEGKSRQNSRLDSEDRRKKEELWLLDDGSSRRSDR